MKPRRGLPRVVELLLVVPLALATLPLLVVLGLLVRWDSPGPALFRQLRVGRGGTTFAILKLRTMHTSATGSAVTASGDPRITRVGRLLRRTRLDELPQLWNVVGGSMALVGPRPEVPRFVDAADPRWAVVLAVRPGITDPTTVAFANEAELLATLGGDPDVAYREQVLPLKLASQAAWLETRTWQGDVMALCATARVVLRA